MPQRAFRVALTHDFRRSDGRPSLSGFDLGRLEQHPRVAVSYLEPCSELAGEQLPDIDALIVMWPKVTEASLACARRLVAITRFGVGYDNVDIEAASRAGVAVTNTPDGVRRPVAVAIDVFETEPLAPDDPLHEIDNVILTPHALCETDQLQAGIGASVLDAVFAVMAGEVPRHVVNRQVIDNAEFRRRLAANRASFAG